MNTQIQYKDNGNTIQCFLALEDLKPRLIGTINREDRTLYKVITAGKHTFNANGSIAIAHELLLLKEYDRIVIQCGTIVLETTREYFLTHSTFKRFAGFELQKFLPAYMFGMDKVYDWKNRKDLEHINRVKDEWSNFGTSTSELKHKYIQSKLF